MTSIKNMFTLTVVFVLIVHLASGEIESACEGSEMVLTCPSDQTIRVNDATYGRTTNTICPEQSPGSATVTCSADNAPLTVSDKCDGLQNCTIAANNTLFGEPCPENTSTYLLVDYNCTTEKVTPVKCNANEHNVPCASNCPETCTNSKKTCDSCTKNGCVCDAGYVRDTKTKKCILSTYCPLPGNNTHETFSQCGVLCQATCKQQNPGLFCQWYTRCEPGYVCTDDRVRDQRTGLCVSRNDCPGCNHHWFW